MRSSSSSLPASRDANARRGARDVGRIVAAVWRGAVALLAIASAVGILAIMMLIVIDVVRRKITGGSIAGVTEYAEILLVVVVFLGVAEAQRQRQHISMETVVNRLPPRPSAGLRCLGVLLSLGVVAWMAWETLDAGLRALEIHEIRFGLARVPTWPAKLAIPLGLTALAIEIGRQLWQTARAATGGSSHR